MPPTRKPTGKAKAVEHAPEVQVLKRKKTPLAASDSGSDNTESEDLEQVVQKKKARRTFCGANYYLLERDLDVTGIIILLASAPYILGRITRLAHVSWILGRIVRINNGSLFSSNSRGIDDDRFPDIENHVSRRTYQRGYVQRAVQRIRIP